MTLYSNSPTQYIFQLFQFWIIPLVSFKKKENGNTRYMILKNTFSNISDLNKRSAVKWQNSAPKVH